MPGSRDGLNYSSIFRLLGSAVADPKDRVKAVGLEGMAVLARCAPALVHVCVHGMFGCTWAMSAGACVCVRLCVCACI